MIKPPLMDSAEVFLRDDPYWVYGIFDGCRVPFISQLR